MRDDGLGPLPRPIPILSGCGPTELIRPEDWFVLAIRVVEYGWPVVGWRYIIKGQFLRPDDPSDGKMLSDTIDRMVQELTKVVGRRHGIWVAHITPDRSMYAGVPPSIGPFEDDPYLPELAVDHLAKAASEYQPLIVFDPGMVRGAIYDPITVLRDWLRDEDVTALGAKAMGGRPARPY